MKLKGLFVNLLLVIAGLQIAQAQGFRVYNSDGTILQFSLRTDSIVFYDGFGSERDLGLFTPVNQMIVGTWYKTKSESVTFNEDGTTDYMDGATYEFLPYQGSVIIYNTYGAPTNILKVYKVSKEKMIVSSPNGSNISVWSITPPPQLVTSIVLSETSLNLKVDETKTIVATVLPEDADNPTVTWESSNEEVAEVNKNGRVIANANGTCTITCAAIDGSGVKAECQVKVVSVPERHELTPIEKSFILYADQTRDSLFFYTFDSWTVTPQNDWISIEGNSHMDIEYDYMKRYLCRIIVLFQPNTTGKTRYGSVLVQSYDYSYSSPFVQLGLLNVSHPAYTVDSWIDEQNHIPEVAHYELVDSANWTNDSICFTVQNNWNLDFADETEPDWLTLDKTTDLPGKYKVNLTLTKNTDTENGRKATLRLTSGEVSNLITVRQLPAKKK